MDNRQFEESVDLLLVEDNPGDVRLVREAFERIDLTTSIEAVNDGGEALENIRTRRDDPAATLPDVVLLDLNLPRVDGFSVLESLRSDPELATIPTLVLTSSEETEDVVRSYELSANTYLTKPRDPEQFVLMARTIEEFWFRHAELPPA